MGDYAEMMLDGTCCESCGEFIGEGAGFARYCSAACEPGNHISIQSAMRRSLSKPKKPRGKPFQCTEAGCNRRFTSEQGRGDHVRDFHNTPIDLPSFLPGGIER